MLFVFCLMVQRYGNILIYQAFLHFLTQYFLCGDSIHTRTYIYRLVYYRQCGVPLLRGRATIAFFVWMPFGLVFFAAKQLFLSV